MRYLTVFTIAILGGTISLSADERPGATKDEMQRLQGTWKLVSLKWKGEETIGEAKKIPQWVVKGDKIVAASEDGKDRIMSYRLDPSKDPKQIDWMEGSELKKGIYKLEGDTWTVCLAFPLAIKDRPTKLEADAEGTGVLAVFERQKGK